MTKKRDALEAIYRRWSTEKLITATTRDADQYDPMALPIMQRVLDERGLSPTDLEHVVADSDAADLSRVKGWLALFIVQALAGATIGLWSVFSEPPSTRPHPIGAIVGIAFSMYGFWCAALLIRRRPNAPIHARRWILLNLFVTLVNMALEFVVNERSLAGATFPAALRSLVSGAVWLWYFSVSKRVAAVYNSPQDQVAAHSR